MADPGFLIKEPQGNPESQQPFCGKRQRERNSPPKTNDAIGNETLEEKTPKQVTAFVTCYLNNRMKRLARIRKMAGVHLVHHNTLPQQINNDTVPWDPKNRRVDRPRFKWVIETIQFFWDCIESTHPEIQQTLDNNDTQQ